MSALSGFAPLSRRRFLRATLTAAGALVAATGGALALRGWAPSVEGLRCLSDQEYRTLASLALALFPEGGAIPPGAAGMDMARAFDDFLADEPEHNRSDLKAALLWLEYGPVLHDRELRTFSHLGEAERLAHFERWGASADLLRRQIALAFRKLMSLVFYDRPEVWPHIGYEGPIFKAGSAP
ncbi:MAG: hypothetical protein IT372_28305 [Polyangiaceae bacterium]|nr:hypothetical protein [Polyangiaceae bacterium]